MLGTEKQLENLTSSPSKRAGRKVLHLCGCGLEPFRAAPSCQSDDGRPKGVCRVWLRPGLPGPGGTQIYLSDMAKHGANLKIFNSETVEPEVFCMVGPHSPQRGLPEEAPEPQISSKLVSCRCFLPPPPPTPLPPHGPNVHTVCIICPRRYRIIHVAARSRVLPVREVYQRSRFTCLIWGRTRPRSGHPIGLRC